MCLSSRSEFRNLSKKIVSTRTHLSSEPQFTVLREVKNNLASCHISETQVKFIIAKEK